MKNYILRSIGTVAENDSSGKIIISNEYIPALLHIGKFSHVIVFWIRRNRNMPDKFNCNSGELKQLFEKYIKYSLSPINLSVAKIINVNEESGSMELSGCIIPGSAVIVDIKPYFPVEDRVKQCLVPDEFSVCLRSFRKIILHSPVMRSFVNTKIQRPDQLPVQKSNRTALSGKRMVNA